MDMEFKSAEEKWEFCAEMHKRFKTSYETGLYQTALIFTNTELFRLVRVLSDIYYSDEDG